MNTTSNQICRYYAQNGACNNGDYCNFQHVQPGDSKFINIGHTNGFGVPKSQRPCRNVATYGYCKYQNRGCEYYHGPTGNEANGEHELSALTHAMQSNSLDGSPKSTTSSSPVPSIELTPVNEHSLQFRPGQRQSRDPSPLHSPRHASPMQLQPVVPIPFSPSRHAPVMSVSRSPPGQYHSMSPSPINGSSPVGSLNHAPYMNGFKPNAVVHLQDPNMHHHEHPNHFYIPAQPHLHNQVAHPVMFIPGPAAVLSQPVQRLPVSFFISDDLKKELQRRSELMLKGSSHDDPDTAQLPRTIHRYYNLYPLENLREENVSKVFGLRTLTLKASAADGRCYALKKVDGIRLHESAVQCVAAWKQLTHSSIVPLREMFVNSAMDNTSTLFLAYDYFPGADTLEERFLRVRGEQERTPIPDDVVWSIAVQIASAMRAIHAAGLSCRIFPSKVLISGRSRVRINWTGFEELLNWDLASKKNISGAQSEDLKCFGKLLLVLCHRSLLALQNVTKALEYIETTYSAEMRNLISRLLETKPAESNQSPPINDICQSISGKILEHLDRVQSTCDDLENDLMKELENGRMFRLLVKLGFINERPEFEQSSSWSETEDRYVLKLFRDFVFHQVYEDGSPSIDFAHVIDALNKLDAGAEEKVMLTSRDQKTTLFISYKDLRRMAGHAFDELFNKFVQSNDEYAKHIQIRNPNPTIGRPLVN